jgi:hypothetical protein
MNNGINQEQYIVRIRIQWGIRQHPDNWRVLISFLFQVGPIVQSKQCYLFPRPPKLGHPGNTGLVIKLLVLYEYIVFNNVRE